MTPIDEPAAPGADPPTGEIVVLVVERDPHVRELEAHFLQGAGLVVEVAVDGVVALAVARARRPQLVITEILVPKLDGLALCRQLKADPACVGTKVLVFSILAARARAEEAGADAFLLKPLAEHRLLGAVNALLDRGPDAARGVA